MDLTESSCHVGRWSNKPDECVLEHKRTEISRHRIVKSLRCKTHQQWVYWFPKEQGTYIEVTWPDGTVESKRV